MENALAELVPPLLQGSNPTEIAPDVQGFTSPRVRMLLNALVARLPSQEAYFEVGCYKGASLISALLGNRGATAYACDNWSERADHRPREHFEQNLKRYEDRLPKLQFFQEDCFQLLDREPFAKKIGVYFYDGDHSLESQRRAIISVRRHLADRVVILVDDWNADQVRQGTWLGIDGVRPKHLEFYELPAGFNGDAENFWNGIGLFYLNF